jgi:hypothetical protein
MRRLECCNCLNQQRINAGPDHSVKSSVANRECGFASGSYLWQLERRALAPLHVHGVPSLHADRRRRRRVCCDRNAREATLIVALWVGNASDELQRKLLVGC